MDAGEGAEVTETDDLRDVLAHLIPKQRLVLRHLAAGDNARASAKRAGVHESEVSKWRKVGTSFRVCLDALNGDPDLCAAVDDLLTDDDEAASAQRNNAPSREELDGQRKQLRAEMDVRNMGAVRSLWDSVPAAISTLTEIMSDEDASNRDRLQAAREVLTRSGVSADGAVGSESDALQQMIEEKKAELAEREAALARREEEIGQQITDRAASATRPKLVKRDREL